MVLGGLALKELERTLANNPSPEVRKRCQSLIKTASNPLVTQAERIQEMRSVHVLELIATDDSRRLLEELSNGTTRASLTQEAKDTLARLKDRQQK